MSGYECIVQNVKLSLMTLNFKQYKRFFTTTIQRPEEFYRFQLSFKDGPPQKKTKGHSNFFQDSNVVCTFKTLQDKRQHKEKKKKYVTNFYYKVTEDMH